MSNLSKIDEFTIQNIESLLKLSSSLHTRPQEAYHTPRMSQNTHPKAESSPISPKSIYL